LRQKGFDVQAGPAAGAYCIHAHKDSTLRRLLGISQQVEVRIDGSPSNYRIALDADNWWKCLLAAGPVSIVAGLATIYSFGFLFLWSLGERYSLEHTFWRQKESSCPKCGRFGAAEPTGEKFVRADHITKSPAGHYQGNHVFTDTFKCRFCSHAWDKGERAVTVELCPKCHHADAKEATGEFVFKLMKTSQVSEDGQPLGEETFTHTFKCKHCNFSWNDGQKTRLVEVCPACSKANAKVHVGDEVIDRYQKNEIVTMMDEHYEVTEKGVIFDKQEYAGQTFRHVPMLVQVEVYRQQFQCRFCGTEWAGPQRTRKR
jgi:Zn finger protein HypA/HybF involved in hydrogenase expression